MQSTLPGRSATRLGPLSVRSWLVLAMTGSAACASVPPSPRPAEPSSVDVPEFSALGDVPEPRPASCEAEANGEAESTRVAVETAVATLRTGTDDAPSWLHVRGLAEAAIEADPDGAESARFRFVSILATASHLSTDELPHGADALLAVARERAVELSRCAPSSGYAALGWLALGDALLSTGRTYEAFETFSRVALDRSATEVIRARARITAAFARVAIAVRENAPDAFDAARTPVLLDSVQPFVETLGEALRASRELVDTNLERTRQRTPRALAELVGTAVRDIGTAFPRLMRALGLSTAEMRTVALELASVDGEGDRSEAREALDFLVTSGVLDASDASACDGAVVDLVHEQVCRVREDANDASIAFVRACAGGAPFVCPPDLEADVNVAVRALSPMSRAIRDCLGSGENEVRRPRAPTLRFEVIEDGTMRLSLVERSTDRRAQRCVQQGLDTFDAHAPHGVLGAPVQFELWDDGDLRPGVAVLRTTIRLESIAIEGRRLPARTPRSISLDDDVFATTAAPTP